MQINLDDNLYEALADMITMWRWNGLSDERPDDCHQTLESVVDEAVKDCLVKFMNDNESLWDWNNVYQKVKSHVKKYEEWWKF